MKYVKLFEQFTNESAGADKLEKALNKEKMSQFTSELRSALKDPKVKAVLNAGLADGSLDDDKFPYDRKRVKCDKLLPTQNEIGFSQSIQNLLTDQYGSLQGILQGNANMGSPIVIYDGKYIIDGHHRWSQAFVGNPGATIDAINIKGRPGYNHLDILKAVHAAVANQLGYVPSNTALGSNILKGASKSEVQKEVEDKLTPEAQNVWFTYGKNIKSDSDIADYLTKNINTMAKRGSAPGAPGREDMPQTDADRLSTETTLRHLQGDTNYSAPYE